MSRERWRLFVRESGKEAEYDAPVEGVPEWLVPSLREWVSQNFAHAAGSVRSELLRDAELVLRHRLDWHDEDSAPESLLDHCEEDPRYFLSVVDLALFKLGPHLYADRVKRLDSALLFGGSAWSVAPDKRGLTRRVLPEAHSAAENVLDDCGRAGELVGKAWRHIYGLRPEPGVGYREAVRAVEAAVCPVVLPDDPTPTLGRVIATMRDAPAKFATIFTDVPRADPVASIRALMELVWKQQFDRHGSSDESVPLSVSGPEAEAALHAAVTLVQWFHRGVLTRKL